MDVMNLWGIVLFMCLNFMLSECAQPVVQNAKAGAQSAKAGVRVRLTENGMKYAAYIGFSIVKRQLVNRQISAAGESGRIQYAVNMKITEFNFGMVEITPLANIGMHGDFSKISIEGGGNVKYRYKKGWIKIRDNVDVTFRISDVSIKLTLIFRVNKEHQPTVEVPKCSANIGNFALNFHGSRGWIYELFKGLVKKKLKNALEDMLCKAVEGWSKSATIPVIKKLDKWARIDYGLTSSPQFTSTYMDVSFKGEFQCVKNPKESNLTVPRFQISTDYKKMIYFWITDYTLNTAGQVYQASNQFVIKVSSWDKKLPQELKSKLNTKTFGLFIPQLQKLYPNLPMSIKLASSRPPKVVIDEGALSMFLYATTTFYVKEKSGKEVEVFCIQFDITTGLSVKISGNHIVGQIKDFKYQSKVLKSNVGKIISLNQPFIKAIIEGTIISRANPFLRKGFPLPTIKNVRFTNLVVKLHKNVIRIGTDVKYQPTTRR